MNGIVLAFNCEFKSQATSDGQSLITDRNILNAVATDAAAATAGVARGVNERQAHQPSLKVIEVTGLVGRGSD